MAERAGVRLDAGHLGAIGVAVERGKRRHERRQLVGREVAAHRQRRVQRRSAVPLARARRGHGRPVGVGRDRCRATASYSAVRMSVTDRSPPMWPRWAVAIILMMWRRFLPSPPLQQQRPSARRLGGERTTKLTPLSASPNVKLHASSNIHSPLNILIARQHYGSLRNCQGAAGGCGRRRVPDEPSSWRTA